MYILENVPLSGYSTMRLGGVAKYLVEIADRNEVAAAVAWASERKLPVTMIGGGSNIVWRDEGFPGLIIVNKIPGFEKISEDDENLYVTIGAGENWDEAVGHCVATGFSGVEELSLIPGTAGATPIQNVGAYGREIADVLVSVQAYDITTGQFLTIPTADCALAYRTSRFKTTDRGRFFIINITLHLTKTTPRPPFYNALQGYLDQHQIKTFTPKVVRDAVVAIRSAKLPDPAEVANNGSFFFNPIVDPTTFGGLQANYPDVPYWKTDDGQIKISAAWLVEQAGFKAMHDKETGMATWLKQPLVLVNENAHSTADLLKFKQKIVTAVQSQFDITLQQEPELLP